MTGIIKGVVMRTLVSAAVFLLLLMTGACEPREKSFIVGVVIDVSIHTQCLDGFKKGMSENGYTEGKNIRYVYNGVIDTKSEAIDAEIKRLLSQNIDMLLTTGDQVPLRAKKILRGKKIPLVMAAVNSPVEQGVVDSLASPGENLTGVQVPDTQAKALEWLKMIVPDLRKVYLPYNPEDMVSSNIVASLGKSVSQMGIELVLDEVHSVEETITAIENLREDIDAIYRIPSPTLDPRNSELSEAAIRYALPMGSSLPLDKAVLITCASGLFENGYRTARLAHQIRLGIKAGDLPIETSEVYLSININTADRIGLHIPDAILSQATTIIR